MTAVSATWVEDCDAQARLSELLTRVAQGEAFTITRQGTPVAILTPVIRKSPETKREAIHAMRELASRHRLDGLKIKELIAEGRK